MRNLLPVMSFLFWSSLVSANGPTVDPHTKHLLSSNEAAQCQFGWAYEDENAFYFVDSSGNPISEFSIAANSVMEYGLVINTTSADFNLLYTLTCKRSDDLYEDSPRVAFLIGANGPADPNITTVGYYGATGAWETNPGVGENFQVSFPAE